MLLTFLIAAWLLLLAWRTHQTMETLRAATRPHGSGLELDSKHHTHRL